MTETAEVMLRLLTCAVNGAAVPDAISGFTDWDALWRLSERHSVTAAVCCGLEKSGLLGALPDGGKNWTEARDRILRKNILMDAERSEILAAFEQEGIAYVPLKGIVMQELYPVYGMREMADNDILMETGRDDDVCRIMEDRGFSSGRNPGAPHDTYRKKPCYNFEMHRFLFSAWRAKDVGHYFDSPWEFALRDSETGSGHHFSDTDFYLYLIAHAYKHYSRSGTGVRSLMDVCIYNRRRMKDADYGIIAPALRDMGLETFEREVRQLAEKVFSPDFAVNNLSETEEQMLSYFVSSGTYGNVSQRVSNTLAKRSDGKVSLKNKIRHLWRRMFLPRKTLYKLYPFCEKHKWAIPYYDIRRIVRACSRRGSRVKAELKAVWKA